jgi:hypothetical protein
MSIIARLCERLASKLEKRVIYRRDGTPYLERYYIRHGSSSWLPGIYLHKFVSSDEDPELHNHPWGTSMSIILSGGYTEEQRVTLPDDPLDNNPRHTVEFNKFSPGFINIVRRDDFHRVELDENPTWTMFFSGDRQQEWGFWNQQTNKYLHWEEHIRRKADGKG